MKKSILWGLLSIFVVSLTFVSCGDDDDDNDLPIVGKWAFMSEDGIGDNVFAYLKYMTYDKTAISNLYGIEFQSNGNCIYYYLKVNDYGTWALEGSTLTINVSQKSKPDVFEMSIDSDGFLHLYWDEIIGFRLKKIHKKLVKL